MSAARTLMTRKEQQCNTLLSATVMQCHHSIHPDRCSDPRVLHRSATATLHSIFVPLFNSSAPQFNHRSILRTARSLFLRQTSAAASAFPVIAAGPNTNEYSV